MLGAQVTEVGEPFATLEHSLFRSEPVFHAEFEIIVEPKALSPVEIRALVKKYGSSAEVGKVIGASEAFVRQNAKK